MKLGQTSVLYTAARFVSSVTGFLSTVYFARKLGDTVLGQYALIFAVVGWFGLVANAGLVKAVTKRISEGEEQSEYFGASLVIAGTVILVAGLVIVLFGGFVDDYVGTSATFLVVFLLVANIGKAPINATLNGKHLVHVNSVLRIVGGFARPGIQIGLVLIGWQLAGMVVGYALGSLLTIVLALYLLDIRPAVPRRRHFRSLFDFAKFSWLGNLSDKFYGTLDITVLGVFVSSGLVGVYSVAWGIVTFLSIFGIAIQKTLFPEMSELSGQGKRKEVADLTETALAYSGLVLIPGLVGSIMLGEQLLRIYGPSFVRGSQVLGVLVAAAIVYTYNKQLLNSLNAIDRPDVAFRSNAVFIGANTVLNVVLIVQYGIVGAAAATLLSAVVGLLVTIYYTTEMLDVTVPVGQIGRQWFAALLMGAVVWFGETTVGSTTLVGIPELTVVVLAGVGAGVYFVVLLTISSPFRSIVFRNLPYLPGPVEH